jgi:L-iditol 2-dehydrogenase
MRAAVYRGPDETRIEELPDPNPGPGEIVVRMLAGGICGSDLMDWYTERRAPLVLGHEPVGVITDVGTADESELPPVGTRVFIHHHVPCFVCDRCRRGHHTLCASFKRSGIHPGGFAELILVPAPNARLDTLVLPDDVSTEAATLIEPLACCIRSQRRAGVTSRTRLAVIGVGQMGLLHVQAALAMGCGAVVAIDPIAGRRKIAESFGAEVAEPDATAVATALGIRPDVVLVCTGARSAFELGMTIVDDGGTVQLFAPTSPEQRFDFDPNELFFREIVVQSSYSAGPMDTREALDLLASGSVTGEGIITHRFPLSAIASALETARSKEAIKVIVEG